MYEYEFILAKTRMRKNGRAFWFEVKEREVGTSKRGEVKGGRFNPRPRGRRLLKVRIHCNKHPLIILSLLRD